MKFLLQESNESINIKIFYYHVFFKDQSFLLVLVEIASFKSVVLVLIYTLNVVRSSIYTVFFQSVALN